MGDAGFLSIAAQNPQLAPYAASPQPVWLWSADGGRILWCNDAGAAALGTDDRHLLQKPRSPADPHGRQVAQLARRLAPGGVTRLERLRGFGARLGRLTTCACSRFEMHDGEAGILLIAVEPPARTALPACLPLPLASVQEASDAIDRILGQPVIDTVAEEPARIDAAGAPDSALPAGLFSTREANFTSAALPGEAGEDIADRTPALHAGVSEPIEESGPAVAAITAAAQALRFIWQIDAAGRFFLASDEFLRIAGERTVRSLGRAWHEVAQALDLDPHGRITQAIARRETFSGITAHWPLERGAGGLVELSGLPSADGARDFAGYRGFGIYRPTALSPEDADALQTGARPVEMPPPELSPDLSDDSRPAAAPAAPETSSDGETDTVEPPQNVVPFPLANDTRMLSLSPIENHAFDEIARRLTQKLDDFDARQAVTVPAEPGAADKPDALHEQEHPVAAKPEHPAWLAAAAPPARGDSRTDRMLLDLMPSGILIYRLDRLLYANHAFLARTGYDSLHALQEAGGLDALYVEPRPAPASSAADDGVALTIAPSTDDRAASDARLFSILWDGDAAHALILNETQAALRQAAAAQPEPPPQVAAAQPAGSAFEAILETATDGIILFDRSGAIVSANPSAEALFGVNAQEFHALNFADLFATESQPDVLEYFESLDTPGATSPIDHGREVLGRERGGGFLPLSMTMGRAGNDDDRFFGVFRDLSQLKKNESDLLNARRKAEHATAAKADALASISHEIRGPLNTIIGFANIMLEERFGTVGNERYADYLKDIRTSGERAIAILDDTVNISSIETGGLDLKLVSQNLNEMVEQCVGVLQPQANRERVIIRTSLAHALPQVMADTQALRQIAMNIITSSIRFSRAGGQVIVSTAPGDNGGAILRVRDTGRGLSEAEVASAMSSHRVTEDRSAIDLSLARALAEANRAQFQIKTTESSGTLIEVAFANVRVLAG